MESIKAVSPTESGIDSRLRKCVASIFIISKLSFAFNGRKAMGQKRLKLYIIDIKYVRNLARADEHVMSVSPQTGKETRPFVGIIIICGTKKYCIPLSSPKPKHVSMKNDVDFTKIMDGERLIGVLNFNKIPVDESCVSSLVLRITEKDDIPSKKYKKMAIKQIEWCRNNQESIVKKANKLYDMIQSEKASAFLKNRCCDFTRLEKVLQKWMEDHKDKEH